MTIREFIVFIVLFLSPLAPIVYDMVVVVPADRAAFEACLKDVNARSCSSIGMAYPVNYED